MSERVVSFLQTLFTTTAITEGYGAIISKVQTLSTILKCRDVAYHSPTIRKIAPVSPLKIS